MTSVREQLEAQRDAMAPEIQALLDVSDEGIGHVVEFSARWCIALRAVLERHQPMRWYSECMKHREDTYPDFEEKHFYVGELGLLTCEEQRQPDVCQECTPDGADDNEIPWPCRTVKDISSALTQKDGQ